MNRSSLFYKIIKGLYKRLPTGLQQRLQRIQYNLLSRRRYNKAVKLNPIPNWVREAQSSPLLIIIPCGFEFDPLVNQRPINAAKYFASKGYFVLFTAWQWEPDEKLALGCTEVYPGIQQIPLFDLLAWANHLSNVPDGIRCYLATIPSPSLVDLASLLRGLEFRIVYDIMDDWEEFSKVGQAPWFSQSHESSLVISADHISAVSPPLAEKFKHLRSDIHIIGNGYNAKTLGLENKNIAAPCILENMTIGYFGHLTDSWFDWDLLLKIAATLPDTCFEIIGYGEPDWVVRSVHDFPNIKIIGKVPPEKLNQHVRKWHIGFIPFKPGNLACAVDPIKIYEYIYFGLPTIVTGIPHLSRYPDTFFADNIEDVIKKIRGLTYHKIDIKATEIFLESTTWNSRFQSIESLLKSESLFSYYEK
jgi:hypothetical protein